MSNQITTLTFLKYRSFSSKAWAFSMMQFAHSFLKGVEGMSFYKLLGTGKGLGFNPFPDWSVYAVLQVWDEEQAAKSFFKDSRLIEKYDSKCDERATIYMKNITAHGEWSSQQPFEVSSNLDVDNPYLAVITRATIRTSKLMRFWKYVPTSQRPIENAKGLIYTKGVGEVPAKQMATYSVWESDEDMRNFAYRSKEHQKAIKLTKELNWYAEEMFSRFQPYDFEGSWEGKKWSFSKQKSATIE